ncbi:MAG TPA: ASPIC/UnbV domain-containing protein, partial [Candidatus Limnocylindrales bacterium]|nr:ASPIC/UnbV domain-containing protein [Candidatus Limnocylindrales bacterium]
FAKARGAALVDLNLDGLLDLVEVNVDDRVRLWRNVGRGTAERPEPLGHWLELRHREDGPNRDAIGSWIEVRTGDSIQRREIVVGGGHAGGQLGWVHFGLGTADEARVRVEWPDGSWGAELTVPADGFTILDRSGGAEPWRPGE